MDNNSIFYDATDYDSLYDELVSFLVSHFATIFYNHFKEVQQ